MQRRPAVPGRIEKARHPKQALIRLALYLKPYRLSMTLVIAMVLIYTLLGLAGPYLMGRAIDQFIGGKDEVGLVHTALLMLGAYLLSNGIVLYCLWALFEGSYEMTTMSAHTLSPATGLPLSYMYGIGVIMSVGMFGIIAVKLYRALFVKGAIEELVVLRESEDDRDFSADTKDAELSQGDKK